MYCAENYISCSIIYILNISGLIIVLAILLKNREFYFREWKRIRQVIKDYTIDYKSDGNMAVFAKFIGVMIGFSALIITSIVSIIMWDSSFGLMEIANIFLWIICGFLFYIDYRSIFKFSKNLRIALGIILTIQLISGIVFAIERNQETENSGLDDLKVEAFVYLTNFIIMLIINVISIFFYKFDYQKKSKNTEERDFLSFNQLNKSLVEDDSLPQTNQQVIQQGQRQSISKQPKRSQSFLDQLDALSSDGQDSSIGSNSIQKLKQEQAGLIDPMYGLKREEEAIQKEKEQKELMNQIMDMHKQLDEKLNNLKKKDEPQQNIQKQNEQNNINELSSFQNDLTMKQSKYEIQNIKIDGFQEIKKQGKRFIYFTIIYFSNSKQKLIKTEHNLKEFHQLRLSLQQIYVDHKFPEIPERKPNERLNGKEVAARGQLLEKFLQFIVNNQISSPQLDKFLKEVQGQNIQIEDEKEPADIDQVLKDKVFDDFLEMRKQSITKKQSFMEKEYNDDSFDPKSSIAGSNFDPNLYFQRNFEQVNQTNGVVYKFIIKEVKQQQSTNFYKIEGQINGIVSSTVLRRYNEFKDLNSKLLEKLIPVPLLPNEPPNKQQDLVAYRQEALAKYINQLYAIEGVKTNMLFKEFVGI